MSQDSGSTVDHGSVGYKQVPPPPTAGDLGFLAIQNKKYDEALTHITKALEDASAANSKTADQIPELLIARSQAYLGLKCHHDLALEDTERAYHLAGSNVRLASLAQYRRAVVLGVMKRYADADACCAWSQHLLEGKAPVGVDVKEEEAVTKNVDADGCYTVTHDDLPATLDERPVDDSGEDDTLLKMNQPTDAPAAWSRAYMWRGFVLREMQKLPADDPGRKLTVRRIPPKPTTPLVVKSPKVEEKAAEKAEAPAPAPKASEKSPKETAGAAKTETAHIPLQAKTNIVPITLPPATPAKLRVDMYQSTSKVNLSLYAKKVDDSLLRIQAGPTTLRLTNLPKEISGPSGTVVLELGGAIDETDVTKRVTPYKIELTLTKKTSGEKWGRWGEQVEDDDDIKGKEKEKKENVAPTLQDCSNMPPVTATATPPEIIPAPAPPRATTAIPSAKPSGPAYPTSSRTGPKNWDKLAADDDDEDGDGDEKSVDAFFKQLYANSTPEQQRAMNKSFTESNGTALSTDWTSVGKGKVEVKPPEGVEAKSWDERQKK
ncbi:Cochaperone protein [Sporothrix bragantina]|uniref:Cochaperone protein n=1 Tax=Sporothrix bragantina TaxID=671064 RepID=A0ABP0B2M2_9PEZI